MTRDWWRGSVTYQIYPRSFMDANGDGVGDIPGITSRLPYLADLGIDAIWLSPFFKSPMKDFGYDVSDYCDVDPVFGTLGDFDRMVEAAHKHGIRVVIDQVNSHCSDKHPAFVESRQSRENAKSDWFVWADPRPDGTPPNNWLSVFGGPAWQWDARRRQYYLHNFLVEQPDFNFHNPEVQDYHLANMRFWLERGVDGFRLDTVNYYFHDKLLRDDAADYRVKERPEGNPYGMQYHLFSKNQPENLLWLERMRKLTDEYGARMMVGEMGESHHPIEMMGQYTSGKRLHQCYSFEMMGYDYTARHFRTKIADFFAGAGGGWPAWAFSNHDVVRHVSRWQSHAISNAALAKQACALLMSFQGSIYLFQGEELGQTDAELSFDELVDPQGINFWPEPIGRDGCRVPMVWERDARNAGFSTAARTWLPIKGPQASVAVDTQSNDPQSVLSFYRKMIAFRKASDDLMDGQTTFLDLPEPLFAFLRGEGTLCIFNLSPATMSVAVAGARDEMIGLANTKSDGTVTLGPNGFAILSVTGTVRVGPA